MADESVLARNGLLVRSLAFMVFQTIMILVLRAYTDIEGNSEFIFWVLVTATFTGYLLFGFYGGSKVTFLVACLPMLIAFLIEPSVSSEPGTEEFPMGTVWIFFSMICLLPAWLLGYLTSLVVRKRSGVDS